jgi:hypothetical protein
MCDEYGTTTKVGWVVSPEHAADFLDNGNEIAWISAASGLLVSNPNLTDWAYAAVSAAESEVL